jgi:hypothetical protein
LKQTISLVVNILERETIVDVDFTRLVLPDAAETAVGEL